MMDFSQFFTPGAWGSFAPRPPTPPPAAAPQGANQPGAPLNISPPAQTNPPPTAAPQGSQPNYGQLFSGIAQMMNNNKPAQPPPLQMPRPAGMGMLNRLGVV